jgi:Zn-dependent M28 family amino/carboxypeptidase
VPILVRAAGITFSALSWLAALGVAAAQYGTPALARLWPAVVIVGAIAGAPVVASVVGARSAGAVDNASGVATALCAAVASRFAPLGVLLTSAEELGLAGARAWVRGRAPSVAINVDGVDDRGALSCMTSGRRPAWLVAVVERAARSLGESMRVRRLLPGVLVDGVALADAGWQVVTISKGTAATLARIHTPSDTVRRLDGRGAAEAAQLIVRALGEQWGG